MKLTSQQLAAIGPISTVIDVGASDGRWSKEMEPHFPNASFVLIEPQHYPAAHTPAQSRWIRAVAGNSNGTAQLNIRGNDQFGAGVYGGAGAVAVRQVRLDTEIKESGPILLKLDAHGTEVPILSGAPETLKRTSAIIMECYTFKVSPTCVIFPHIMKKMETVGFRMVGILDTLYRDDGCLWQLDVLFLRSANRMFERETFQ